MRSTVIWSFLSLVALATGGLMTGCDSDAKIAKSAEGESCDKTADCNDGLKCIQDTCYKTSPGGGNEGGEGTGTGGSVSGPPEPVLSSLGESCTKRADCEADLACFNQVCVETNAGEGGGGNLPEVRKGALGETCQESADCEDGLPCIPGGYPGYPVGTPWGFVGVCGYAGGALPPTGKSCFAECVEPTDCCELPLELHVANSVVAPWGAGAESCADLAVQLDGINCDGVLSAANAAKCFAKAAYCDCDADTWACTAGQCVYAAACADDGATTDGCPYYSRSGKALVSVCNADDECAPAPVDPTCTTKASCNGEVMADLGVVCEDGECTCYEDTGLCYRACDTTLDCKPGQVCDEDNNVCVPSATCTTDAQCAVRMGSSRYTCIEATCQLTCASDFECNGGSFQAGINTLVCGPDKTCQAIGCSTDDDCSSGEALTGVRMFCTVPEPAVGGVIVNSAITD